MIVPPTASIRFAWPRRRFVPGRGVGVLEVGHEDVRAGVQGVDDHLPVGRAGDLDAPVEQVRRRIGATVQSDSRSAAVSGRKSGALRVQPAAWRSAPPLEERLALRARTARTRSARNARAPGVRIRSAPATCGLRPLPRPRRGASMRWNEARAPRRCRHGRCQYVSSLDNESINILLSICYDVISCKVKIENL